MIEKLEVVDHDVDAMIDRLCSERPHVHVDGDDQLVCYGVDRRMVSFLREHVTSGQRTIETGAGVSTILLLLLGAEHTAVSPDAGEPARIRDYCERHDIAAEGYEHLVGGSEEVLPSLPKYPQFDLALVDGNHAFPAPCIDWFYLTRVLKKGGIIALDDLQLWPCRIVADFLDAEEVWQKLIRTERIAAYRMLAEPEQVLARWWGQQPYVTRQPTSQFWAKIRKMFLRR